MRRLLDQARAQGDLSLDADPEALASALLGAFYADHLAVRAPAVGWAEHTVAVVLAPASLT
ncbi:hypothetical protein [Streptomyces sp. NBC_00154]|uniref:hypothetical protein n=1 Tax=Streptomyces sp. NBC_00154 TaxID=2975670 RepID=UPI002254BB4B|nr:hypothetical protein [Streptomyces sp. NBC_00154]MCX5317644.1 hypothetical protein [Streptomyces sp. NBC_00154]